MTRRFLAGLVGVFSLMASAVAGPAEEEYFVAGLAFASVIENGCPVLTINEDVKHAYMRAIGITDADLSGRLFLRYLDKFQEIDAQAKRSPVAAPVYCRVGEEKFGQ